MIHRCFVALISMYLVAATAFPRAASAQDQVIDPAIKARLDAAANNLIQDKRSVGMVVGVIDGQHSARVHYLARHDDRACAARCPVAYAFGACKLEPFAQRIAQCDARLHIQLLGFPVDG